MIKSEREQLQDKIEQLKSQHRELMRGRMIPSSRAQAVERKILSIQEDIKRLDHDAAERLALERAPIDDVLLIIAIPLLADVVNDIVADVNGMLRRRGCQETVFGIYASQIHKAAMSMVDTLDHDDAGLPFLLDVDDTLIDAVRKKLMSFIKQRLKINK